MFAKIVAAIAFIVTVVVEHYVFGAMDRHDEKNDRMRKAEELGHIVTAVRDNKTVRFKEIQTGEDKSYLEWSCTYKYEVNGKMYKKTLTNMSSEPSERTVFYYTDNPAKAFVPTGPDTSGKTIRFILSLMLPIIVCGFVYGVLS